MFFNFISLRWEAGSLKSSSDVFLSREVAVFLLWSSTTSVPLLLDSVKILLRGLRYLSFAAKVWSGQTVYIVKGYVSC